ncbi:MAG: transposase [Alphaproteobacteria bacterium]|nr:transposase [Alphaproteobacteria bacterium]
MLSSYVDIISGNISPDYMLISIPPRLSISKIVQYVKGRSSKKL